MRGRHFDYRARLALRRLLVTGVPQGPLLVVATVRGSPEGGRRTGFAINWNLRQGRTLALHHGGLRLRSTSSM